MIALDTNVLVRFLTQDDPQQFAQAAALIAGLSEERPGYLCREVVIELVWVLERAYHLSRQDIAGALDGLLAAQELLIEAADRVGLAVERYRQGGAGFSDQMIALAARDQGCEAIFSFDRQAVVKAGMMLVPEAQ
ncbi:PIN domain-containing protein [Paracoccus aminophilus]|uniref:PIN domain-containing protein n=1 Tax=Paracoccus aminophilus JCM 7686 TaxID=1367847 RepID=S5XT62_PARAH|nr:type II toxin-antitoxin system VapC family toxin [Paracoccus aminophilus]AGT10664.1 hypothetical protein JCM7686_pAMI1p078 [Paracoccus aminophilus JCM 7686]